MFIDLLKSQSLASLSVLHQVHRPVGPVGDELDDLKVLLGGRLGLGLELTVLILLMARGARIQAGQRITVGITGPGRRAVPRAVTLTLEQTEVLLQSGEGIPVQPQLGDDVLRQSGLYLLVPSGLALGCHQQLIKLL